MTAFAVREIDPQHTAVVRVTTSPDKLPEIFSSVFPETYAHLGATGSMPAGPPFARYFSFGPTFDVEIGVPVADQIAPDGRVRPGELPGGRAVVGIHVGPYDRLHETYEAMERFIADQGLVPAGAMWERYLTGPEDPDPSTWRTEIVQPVT
jgi:effector-binding domain-containing protein